MDISIERHLVLAKFKFPCPTLECEETIWRVNVPCGIRSLEGFDKFSVFTNSITAPIKCRRCGIDSMDLEVLNNILKERVSDYLLERGVRRNLVERRD